MAKRSDYDYDNDSDSDSDSEEDRRRTPTIACRGFWEDDVSLVKINRMRLDTIVKRLRKGHVHRPGDAAVRSRNPADQSFAPPSEIVPYESTSLAAKGVDWQCTWLPCTAGMPIR